MTIGFPQRRLREPLGHRTEPRDVVASHVQETSSRLEHLAVSGKFFQAGSEKWYLKGLTYGPFAPNSQGLQLPEPQQLRADLAQIRALGANCIRLYHIPPRRLLDMAQEQGLRVFVDVPWEKHRCFFEDWSSQEDARQRVRQAAIELSHHPALMAISVVNELPADVVRFYGHRRVERFVDELIDSVKQVDARCLATFASYPPTEFLSPQEADFTCFNVYLNDPDRLAAYVDRLQHLAGARPLVLGEFGLDSIRNGEARQALALRDHVERVFDHGLAGSFVFSFTDDWYTGGHQIDDWAFGVTRMDRSEKPAATALRSAWAAVPQVNAAEAFPRVSVVVCSYNGGSTLEECLQSLQDVRYPDYEVILVDDGSTDNTRQIAQRFPWVRAIHQANTGLSIARNTGAQAATGEIVAYTDSDCVADPDWLYYLVQGMRRQGVVAMGGPNVPPPSDGWTAKCVAGSPGGPSHVMLDDHHAEHIPGCNMAFRRDVLLGLGGFDAQFCQAGDDVDICWRFTDAGYKIGYAASALVWHHRRTTVKAYLKQQKGYGRAEAMLMRKHPRRFNRLGASLWNGVIYGEGAVGLPVLAPVIYHGRFGGGLFQSIYAQNKYSFWAVPTLLEWHAMAALLVVLGVMMPGLWIAAGAMWALTGVAAWQTARATRLPRAAPWWCRPVVFALHILQPVVRAWHRYRTRLAARHLPNVSELRERAPALRLRRIGLRHFDAYWMSHDNRGRGELLATLEEQARRLQWGGIFDDDWSTVDALLLGDRWHSIALRTATEELGWPRRFTRARATPQLTTAARACAAVLLVSAAFAAISGAMGMLIACGVAAVLLAAVLTHSRWRTLRAVGVLLAHCGELAELQLAMPSRPRGEAAGLATEGPDELEGACERVEPAMR